MKDYLSYRWHRHYRNESLVAWYSCYRLSSHIKNKYCGGSMINRTLFGLSNTGSLGY